MGESETPSFRRPPVIETVLGIQFAPLKQWHAGYFGLYWHKVRSEFPKVEIQPPIASKIEPAEFPANIRIELLSEPELRAWYLSENGTELIQIQNDRFLLNWRSTSDEVAYPRYRDRVRPLFIAQWKVYRDFLESEKIESPSIVLCEVTYINHIPKGDGWQVSADWDKVFTVCGNLRGEKFLPDPESRRFGLNYQNAGRAWQPKCHSITRDSRPRQQGNYTNAVERERASKLNYRIHDPRLVRSRA